MEGNTSTPPPPPAAPPMMQPAAMGQPQQEEYQSFDAPPQQHFMAPPQPPQQYQQQHPGQQQHYNPQPQSSFMDSAPEPSPGAQAFESLAKYGRQYQTALDRTTPHTLRRWGATAGFLVLFFIRILWVQAYYIVCYALGIYLLNLFLAFLQPKFDPSLAAEIAENEQEEGAPGLPTSMGAASSSSNAYGDLRDGEFRPFIRRLPEFKFWYAATKAILISTVATIFPVFDIPVFWPILLVYFCILFVITMRRQISHMRKYKYLPFDIGRKTQYGRGSTNI